MRPGRAGVRGGRRRLRAVARAADGRGGAPGARPAGRPADAAGAARERGRSGRRHGRRAGRCRQGAADARGDRRVAGRRGGAGRGDRLEAARHRDAARPDRHLQHRRRVALPGLTHLYCGASATMRIAILDPAAGISGDMTLGALLSLGAPAAWLEALPRRLGGGFEQVGVEAVECWPGAVGPGGVEAAHGRLPVPAPATAILLEGVAVATGGPVEGEATTPTGAAWLRVLSAGPPPAQWRLVKGGWGAGQRDPRHYPNALRILLAERAAEAARVALLATDVDDMSPEYVEPLRQALIAAGALDVQTWPVQMKKARSGFRLEVVAPEEQVERSEEHTSELQSQSNLVCRL